MATLMPNYSGATGEWVSAGKSAIWSENGMLVTVSGGTGEELVVATRRSAVWDGVVLPVPLLPTTFTRATST
jgi:hypothetical protein